MHVTALKDALEFSRLKRVLVVKLRHHGDVLLTSPVFTVLKSRYPFLEVDALVYRETADMLSLHPGLDQLHVIDRNWKKKGLSHLLAQEWALLQRLKARHYDLLIVLTEQWRAVMLKRLLGIPYAVSADYGRRQSPLWKSSFTHLYPETRQRHKVEFHLDALRRLGLNPKPEEKRLSLTVAAEDREKVSALLAEAGVTGPYMVLHPASRWFYKCWEPDKYAALIDRLMAQGHTLVLTGAPSTEEKELIKRILASAKHRPVDLSGRLTLKQLAEVIDRATCFIGVDSVPMHMAAAMDTPLVALFGPSSQDIWRPWCQRYEIVSTRPSCQPCFQHGCADSEFSECISRIEVEQVLRAVERVCGAHDQNAILAREVAP